MSSKHHHGLRNRAAGPWQPLVTNSPPTHHYLLEGHGMPGPVISSMQRGRPGHPSPHPADGSRRQPAPSRAGRQLISAAPQAQAARQTARQKDKWIALPEDAQEEAAAATGFQPTAADIAEPLDLYGMQHDDYTALTITPGLFQDRDARGLHQRGRITLYCVADSFDRKKLDELLRGSFPASAIKSYPDVFYVEYFAATEEAPGGDLFFFDYGVVACWGLEGSQEQAVISTLARSAAIQPVEPDEVEVDQFEFNYSLLEKPHIQNDTVTLHRKAAKDHQIKLAISYALAQSTKLSLHERRVADMVLETKHLPESLARSGRVSLIPGASIAKLIGKVFIQKSAVNLLSSVLDTPEFFWRAPDSYQSLYQAICQYLELEQRVEVLNARFTVLQEMLDMLREHEANHHSTRLEWIIIYLIVIEVIVGLLEILGLFGIVGDHGQ